MINFTRIGSKHKKPPICLKVPKIPMIMHEKCMKSRNKLEKEGQKELTSFLGQKPCKNLEGKRQKLDGGA